MTKTSTNFIAFNIQPSLSRSTSARGDCASISRYDEDKKIEEGVALLVRKEKDGKNFFKCWTFNEFSQYASKYPKREKKYKGNYKPIKDRECVYANEENDYDDRA